LQRFSISSEKEGILRKGEKVEKAGCGKPEKSEKMGAGSTRRRQ